MISAVVIIALGILAAVAFLVVYRCLAPKRDISQEQLLEWMAQQSDLCILDVRSADEYNSGHVPDAIHIGHKEITSRLDEMKRFRNKNVVVYCERGVRARIAQNALLKAGFSSVYHLAGDMAAWRNAGRRVETETTRSDN